MPESITIGANPQPLKGPGTLTHEGGDTILIAPVEDGLPGTEHSLVFEGGNVVVDGDDIFHPADARLRTEEIKGTVLVRALGQASATYTKDEPEEEPEEEPVAKKPAAKKRAAKKQAAKEVDDIAA